MAKRKRRRIKMDNNNNQGDGKFFSGFLIGLLIGAAVVFLLATKRGKKLLKAISEDGIDNISNLLEKGEKTEELDEVVIAEKPRKEFVRKREFAIKEIEIEEKPKVRRFFRGISRRVN